MGQAHRHRAPWTGLSLARRPGILCLQQPAPSFPVYPAGSPFQAIAPCPEPSSMQEYRTDNPNVGGHQGDEPALQCSEIRKWRKQRLQKRIQTPGAELTCYTLPCYTPLCTAHGACCPDRWSDLNTHRLALRGTHSTEKETEVQRGPHGQSLDLNRHPSDSKVGPLQSTTVRIEGGWPPGGPPR